MKACKNTPKLTQCQCDEQWPQGTRPGQPAAEAADQATAQAAAVAPRFGKTPKANDESRMNADLTRDGTKENGEETDDRGEVIDRGGGKAGSRLKAPKGNENGI